MIDELLNDDLKKTIKIQALEIIQKKEEIQNLKKDFQDQKQKREELTNLGYAELKKIIQIQAIEIDENKDLIKNLQKYHYLQNETIINQNTELENLMKNFKIY